MSVSARSVSELRECTICWMGEEPLRAGRRYAIKHTTRTVRATVQAIHERTDPETLARQLEPSALAVNDIGQVTLRTSSVVLADPYTVNRVTGAFILIDEHSNDTVKVTTRRSVERPGLGCGSGATRERLSGISKVRAR